jgi:hypothetical protein
MSTRTIAITVLVSLTASCPVWPQSAQTRDFCLAMLRAEVYDEVAQSTSGSSYQEVRSHFCEQHGRNSKSSNDTSLNVVYDGIPIGGSHDKKSSQAAYDAFCRDDYSLSKMSHDMTLLTHVVGPAVGRTLQLCAEAGNSGVHIENYEYDPSAETLTVGVKYYPVGTETTKFKHPTVIPAGITCDGELARVKAGTTLKHELVSMVCSPTAAGGQRQARTLVVQTALTALTFTFPGTPKPVDIACANIPIPVTNLDLARSGPSVGIFPVDDPRGYAGLLGNVRNGNNKHDRAVIDVNVPTGCPYALHITYTSANDRHISVTRDGGDPIASDYPTNATGSFDHNFVSVQVGSQAIWWRVGRHAIEITPTGEALPHIRSLSLEAMP